MKIAKQIACMIMTAIEDGKDLSIGTLEMNIAAKLEPVREVLVAIAGPCEHMGSGGLRCTELEEYDGDTECLPCRANELLAMFEEDS